MHDFPFTMEYVLRDVCNAELKRDRANGKGEVVVCCPLRSGKTFEVNLYKEYWKCFKGCTDCPVNGKGGLLDLSWMSSSLKQEYWKDLSWKNLKLMQHIEKYL